MGLQVLTITAYKDENFGSQSSGINPYKAMLNPDSFSEDLKVTYKDQQSPGKDAADNKYQKTPPSSLNFSLTIDGTGVVDASRTDVAQEIANLKKVVYTTNGEIHTPNYVKVVWGAFNYQGRLTSMKVDYTMFKASGAPVRAKVTLSFTEVQESSGSKNQSPDMSKSRIAVAGDSLARLTYDAYDDEIHLIKVATYNKLDSLLQLTPGTRIEFPPIISN